MVKVSQLYRFVAVVEAGSINKASERLYISQPTLSTSLKELENEIGKTLLTRSERGVTLTKDGEVLYMYSQSVLKELQQIETLKEGGGAATKAKLNVSVYSLLMKGEMFTEFCEKFDVAERALSVNEVIFEEMVDNVCHGISDVGVGVINEIELAMVQNMAQSRNLTLNILDSGSLYIHSGPKCKLYDAEKIMAEDLEKTTFVHLPFDTYSILRRNVKIDGLALGELKKTLIINNYPLMVRQIHELDAFMLGNQWQLDDIKLNGLLSRKIDGEDIGVHLITLTSEKRRQITPETEFFLDAMQRYYVDSQKKD